MIATLLLIGSVVVWTVPTLAVVGGAVLLWVLLDDEARANLFYSLFVLAVAAIPLAALYYLATQIF